MKNNIKLSFLFIFVITTLTCFKCERSHPNISVVNNCKMTISIDSIALINENGKKFYSDSTLLILETGKYDFLRFNGFNKDSVFLKVKDEKISLIINYHGKKTYKKVVNGGVLFNYSTSIIKLGCEN